MLAKLVVLVGLVVLVWKAYQWGALAQRRKMAGGAPAASRPGGRAPRATEPAAEDLHACAICGAYVARGSTPCGKPECPQRR
ncbi:hypothetical protein [Nitrospirillum amazonense]|uniref:Uncharacterized protein n=1 Tax=Nitrospirillum amazonense TaxID=28077 RepID=A0A560KQ90_9PROT|nr:hypothetical protein [Nitrospirillum amazonense]MDG3443050.1 hypothetical protein [Nitrospirillum amazonense]TWB82810.1 hypothetical protein FBZ87_101521 [Nitrospirillum amazonense]